MGLWLRALMVKKVIYSCCDSVMHLCTLCNRCTINVYMMMMMMIMMLMEPRLTATVSLAIWDHTVLPATRHK